MRSALRWLGLLLVALLVTLGVMVLIMGREGVLTLLLGEPRFETIAFETLQPDDRPNHYLVCPEGLCAAVADRPSPRFAIGPESLRDKWLAMVSTRPRVDMVAADEALLQYDFVQRSAIFGFPDSVTVRFLPREDGGSTLAIFSRAHYGYEDFGVNRDRVEAWLVELAKLVES